MTTAALRQEVIELLNEALSAEYHSFIGHALNSNPFVAPGMEKDVDVLERLRDDENANAKALLVQLGRYRAGPTIKAFAYWKEDLNFLGIDWLVVRASEIAKQDVARVEALEKRVPKDDAELAATMRSILETKRRHAAELATLATKRQKERDARRAAAYAATSIPMKKAAPAKAAAPAAAAPAAGAPKAPPLPGAPKAPTLPGAPKPPSPPLPGALKPPSPPLPGAGPKPPSPPLPPGAPKPPSPPKPPGAPTPPKPSSPPASAPSAPAPAAAAPSAPAAPSSDGDGPKLAGPPGSNYKPTPPKPYVPKPKG